MIIISKINEIFYYRLKPTLTSCPRNDPIMSNAVMSPTPIYITTSTYSLSILCQSPFATPSPPSTPNSLLRHKGAGLERTLYV